MYVAPPATVKERTALEGAETKLHVHTDVQYMYYHTCSHDCYTVLFSVHLHVYSIIAELLEKSWDTTEEEEVIPKKKENPPKPLPGE